MNFVEKRLGYSLSDKVRFVCRVRLTSGGPPTICELGTGDWNYPHFCQGPPLALVMDLFSRAIVGWSMADQMPATLVEQALLMALGRRRWEGPLVHHSDRGRQYTSALIQNLLAAHHIQVSMSGVGHCYDNAPMESFIGTLKTECPLSPLAPRAEVRLVIFDYIEVWYNRQRLHSSLGYLSPATFEDGFYETKTVR